MKNIIAASVFCVLTGIVAYAQQKTDGFCAHNRQLKEVFKMYPELEEGYYANRLLLNSRVNKPNSNNSEKSSPLYTVPVVFHILHQYGAENITDAQVYDAMEVINREFNAADPDSVDIVAEFDTLIGNSRIDFKLAAIDPYGNCTNGINRIYTHETNIGDAYSKLNQWNRSRYLNIWVVKIVGTPGAAAYATPPASTDGAGYWYDGVLSNHTYVGSTGTSSPGVESVLTHELGHWLGLAHTFGDSDLINEGPTICNDDGIQDTPVTRGHLSCPMGSYPAGWIDCDTTNGGVVEDIQNYMDYSYCDVHFTPGQVNVMHNALIGISGQRNNLWTDSTLMLTGVADLQLPQDPSNPLTVPTCVPVADFSSSSKTICVGEPMTFSDASWNAIIDSRTWTFEGGTPATSTAANPSVTFDTPGYKTVTLAATNSAGTGTETRTNYIYVSPKWGDFNGPNFIDLEGASANWFIVHNPEDNHARFELNSNTGYNNSTSFKLNNFKDITGADPFTDDYFYNSRLGLNIDELVTPSFDLRYTTGVTVSFKYSYATNATQIADISEELKVYYSNDCGESWLPRNLTVDGAPVGNSLTGDDIVTGGFAGFTDYVPLTNNDWRTASFTYNPTSLSDHARFKFQFIASDFSSNLYIDEINIGGTLNLFSDEIALLDLNVYPNPSSNGNSINVSYTAQNEPVTFTLRDVQGKVITTEVLETTNSLVKHTLQNTDDLQSSCYFLEVQSGDFKTTRKVIVL